VVPAAAAEDAEREIPTMERSDASHTVLYRREDGEWRLVHEHVSFGVPNEAVLGQGVAA
jgi:ketosteroid isomerase-like protein